MRSPSRKTFIFVGILLLFLLSFVSAELNKRDPQAADPEADPPAKEPPAKAPAKAPAKDAKDPADDGDGKQAKQPNDAKQQPADDAKQQPADDAKQPADDAKQPADDAKQPADTKQPANGGKTPAADGKLPAEGQGKGAGKNVPPKNINPNAPPVQVQIIEPKSAKNILYKIGQNITFRWTYSANFSNPPEVITVMAQPIISQKTFYFISNITTLNDTQEVNWDTSAETSSLPMADYKLWICDENGIDAVPPPGGLQPFSNLQFGLYQPQNNEPFSCPSCTNTATSITPLLSTIGLTLITIISFCFTLI